MTLRKNMILSAVALLLAVSIVAVPSFCGIALAAESETPLDDTEDVSHARRSEPGPDLQPLGDGSEGPPPDD